MDKWSLLGPLENNFKGEVKIQTKTIILTVKIMLIRLKIVLKWSLLKLRFFHPLLSFPWIHTQQWYFVFSVCYYWSPAKIAKNACVPEWSRLDKYHPSTFRVRQSDMCSLCHRHERAECSNMMSLCELRTICNSLTHKSTTMTLLYTAFII